jgi:DNA mismatch endonuclease, patch repair protein
MAKIHRRDTSAELRLRKGLWRAGVRGWRCDVAALPGRPDLAFTRWQVAVFVDGLLWHGHPRRYPARLNEAWRLKIARNVERDRRTETELRSLGWEVVRLWDDDIRTDLVTCVAAVVRARARAIERRTA